MPLPPHCPTAPLPTAPLHPLPYRPTAPLPLPLPLPLPQTMAEHFTGKEVSMAVLEVARASRKVVCSVVKAKENDDLRRLEVSAAGAVHASHALGLCARLAAPAGWTLAAWSTCPARCMLPPFPAPCSPRLPTAPAPLPPAHWPLQVGTLVSGTVRRIEPFGVFVGINNTRVSGLLHISNLSRQHVDSVQVGGNWVGGALVLEAARQGGSGGMPAACPSAVLALPITVTAC